MGSSCSKSVQGVAQPVSIQKNAMQPQTDLCSIINAKILETTDKYIIFQEIDKLFTEHENTISTIKINDIELTDPEKTKFIDQLKYIKTYRICNNSNNNNSKKLELYKVRNIHPRFFSHIKNTADWEITGFTLILNNPIKIRFNKTFVEKNEIYIELININVVRKTDIIPQLIKISTESLLYNNLYDEFINVKDRYIHAYKILLLISIVHELTTSTNITKAQNSIIIIKYIQNIVDNIINLLYLLIIDNFNNDFVKMECERFIESIQNDSLISNEKLGDIIIFIKRNFSIEYNKLKRFLNTLNTIKSAGKSKKTKTSPVKYTKLPVKYTNKQGVSCCIYVKDGVKYIRKLVKTSANSSKKKYAYRKIKA